MKPEKRWRKIALYCRVSKKDQTVEQQEASIRSWIGHRCDSIVVFPEKMSSKKIRPIKEAMMVRVRAREFDAVAVWKIDRFARDSLELLQWRGEARAIPFDILSIMEGLDTSTSIGRFIFTIMAGVAEFERDTIEDRITNRNAYRRSQGMSVGRKRKEFDVEKALRLNATHSVRELASALGVSKGKAERIKKEIENGTMQALARPVTTPPMSRNPGNETPNTQDEAP